MTTTEISQDNVKTAYQIIYNEIPDDIDKVKFAQRTYVSKRLNIINKLVYIHDNPDLFKGFITKVDGFRNWTDGNNYTRHMDLFLTVSPNELAYANKDSVFAIGKKIINSLSYSDIYDLIDNRSLRNEDRHPGIFNVLIRIPESIAHSDKRDDNWIYETTTKTGDVILRVQLYDDEHPWETYGFLSGAITREEALEHLNKQFISIYSKEKKEQSNINRRD